MAGSLGYALWLLETLLEVAVLVCALNRRSFGRYLCLNLYMLLSLLVGVGRYAALAHFGLPSSGYRYFYYYSDALLTIFLYLALIPLYLHAFNEMKVTKYVRPPPMLLSHAPRP